MNDFTAGTWHCQEPDCTEPTVIAYIDADGCLELHAALEQHWEDGGPRLPNHHNVWYPLTLVAES